MPAGVLKIVAAALIWGSMGVLIRLAALSPIVTVFWRSVFATIAMAAIVAGTGHTRDLAVSKRRVLLPLTGVLLVLSMVFFAKAVQFTTVAGAILIVYTAPVLIAVLAPVTLGERFERRTPFALALALAGIALIVAPQGVGLGGRHILGVAFAAVTAVSYALLVLVGKKVVEDLSARVVAFYQSVVAVIVLLPLVVGRALPSSSGVWTMLVVLGVVHTAIAGVLYLSGLRSVKAQDAGILAYFEPLSAAIYGMIFLGEALTVYVVAGGALIVVAGRLVIRARPPELIAVPK